MQRREPHREQAEADEINRRRFVALNVRRIFHEPLRGKNGHNAYGQIDVENPAPRIAVRNPAAERRAKNGSDDDALREDGHRRATFLARKTFEHDGLRDWNHRAAADALQNSRENQRWQTPRQSAQRRRDGEHHDTGDENAFASEVICQPAGRWQYDGVRDEIARQHPRCLFRRRRQTARDVRQRDVGDARVEHFHERRHHHAHRDEPRAVARFPFRLHEKLFRRRFAVGEKSEKQNCRARDNCGSNHQQPCG